MDLHVVKTNRSFIPFAEGIWEKRPDINSINLYADLLKKWHRLYGLHLDSVIEWGDHYIRVSGFIILFIVAFRDMRYNKTL